jgi:hypothetical protein
MMKIDIKIVGTSYRGDDAEKQIRAMLNGGDLPVSLEADEKNEHDKHAVKIMVGDTHVGFVPRDLAPTVRGWLAAGMIAGVRIVRPWNISVELDR